MLSRLPLMSLSSHVGARGHGTSGGPHGPASLPRPTEVAGERGARTTAAPQSWFRSFNDSLFSIRLLCKNVKAILVKFFPAIWGGLSRALQMASST